MKQTLFILLLLSFINTCSSQFIVTKVIGTVKKKSTGELLKPGSKLIKNEPLMYSSKTDMVRVIEAGKGISIITQNTKTEKNGNNVWDIVQFTLHIKSKEGNLSGRGGKLEMLPEALNTESTVNNKNCITKENKYLFDKNVFDGTGGNKFFLQSEIPGADPIIKSLQTQSDTLLLLISDFKVFQTKDAGNVKYTLGFYSKENNTSKSIIQIKPYFDSTSEMETIIKTIVLEDKQTDKEKLQEKCYMVIYEALGKPSDIIFNNIFDKIIAFKLKKASKK